MTNQIELNLPPNTTIKINQFVVMIDKDGSLLAFNSQDVKLEDGDINTGVKFSAPAFKIASGEITDGTDCVLQLEN